MPTIPAKPTSVNANSTITNSGAKLTRASLQQKVSTGSELTVTDTIVASFQWSLQQRDQYPSILDVPRRTAVAAEHMRGLIRSLTV